ncbi:hypothetical protein [uncultured Methanobrevibacter sp.]|uniref:hypothetical protein n=1 Tax=uncultured Methanobrevibacter sp. TaxID=253161 RepID=UPI0025D6741A|nr:hypothetical protein [uncultured Methanobrevibacter sp.]
MAEGRRIMWDDEDKVLYDYLRQSSGPFKGMSLIDLFAIALTYGKEEGVRTKLGKGNIGRIRESTIANSNVKYLMMAIAVEEEQSIDVLLDEDEYFTIAEEYAKTGVKFLHSEFKDYGKTMLDNMALDLIEFIEENIEES